MLCRVRLYCGQQKQYVILIKYDYTTAHSFYTTNDVVCSTLEPMDLQTQAFQARTDAKLRYAKVHLDELAALPAHGGDDFDRAHQESFLFHLYGTRDAFLIELNHYYGLGLPIESLTPGKLREALKLRGIQSPELSELFILPKSCKPTPYII